MVFGDFSFIILFDPKKVGKFLKRRRMFYCPFKLAVKSFPRFDT